MACMCLKCILCVLFIFTTFTAYGFEDLYLYNTGIDSDSHISLKLLSTKLSNLHKRQTTQTNISDNRTNQQVPDPPIQTTSATNVTINNSTKIVPTVQTKNSTLNATTIHNLGENGAGIRKYNTSTTMSTIVSSTTPTTPVTNKTNKEVIVAKNNQTDSDDDEISITKFANEEGTAMFNKTLEQNDINETRTDGHVYYNSSFKIDSAAGNHYWVDMTNRSDVIVNDLLSKSHRRASTIKLSFDFPFYGHLIQNVTIATGGFLYTGEYVHSWLAATQYIAPLMANFDTSLSNNSLIRYVDNGTSFTVEWKSVSLQDRPKDGQFTFQTTLFSTGDIVFVYKSVPLIVESIRDDHHPVKIGLSDAYIIDRTIFYVRRKTIYEYHRVNFKKEDIKNSTIIYLTALPTCLDHKDCDSCLARDVDSFRCTWCWQIKRCSNGFDRHRQDWLTKGCDRKQITNGTMCSNSPVDDHDNDGHEFYYGSNDASPQANPAHKNSNNTTDDKSLINRTLPINAANKQETLSNTIQAPRVATDGRDLNQSMSMGATGILTLLFLIAFVAGLGVWVLYAYRNPHTTSGQILIRYRPSQWRWKRGEARYTAATIHM